MDETFTTLNLTVNPSAVKESDVLSIVDEDEVFYQEICSELDMLQKNPQQQTIENILNFSKNLR